MAEALYDIVYLIAEIHNYILTLNDAYEANFSDKQLHFIVIGLVGMAMVFVIYPIFKFLAKRKCYLTLTWIYTFTVIIVLTFAIEIGQEITHTGGMEFDDIVFGVAGFLLMFMCFSVIVCTIRGIYLLCKLLKETKKEEDESTKKIQ